MYAKIFKRSDKSMNIITIKKPDDWHLHLRDGDTLRAVLPESERHFARALVMPNLIPPITSVAQAIKYKASITDALQNKRGFTPLMTLYLTENTKLSDIQIGFETGLITAVKMYPAGATTNSDSGVKNFTKVYPILELMEKLGLPLCVHGEVTDEEVDIFDREAVFIEKILDPILNKFSKLKVVMEHITTESAVDYIKESDESLAATITTHHLVINRNNLLSGGIRPHYYCLPIAKRESHRLALVAAATSGSKSFFLGTDSAPHFDFAKESACGCAGCFTATNSIPIITQVFDNNNSLENLEAFISKNGANFYNLKQNKANIILEKGDIVDFPKKILCQQGNITVFDPGFSVNWKVRTKTNKRIV